MIFLGLLRRQLNRIINMSKIRVIIYERDLEENIKESVERALDEENAPNIEIVEKLTSVITEFMRSRNFFHKNGDGVRFVGFFQIKEYNLLVYSLPKYLSKTEHSRSNPDYYMTIIRKIIEKTGHLFDYENSDVEFNPYIFNREKSKVSRFDMAKWLVEDYENNGIFTIREKKHTKESRGRIAWNKTIIKTIPLINDNDVVYTAPIRSYIARNDKLLLSDIHKCVVKEAMDDLTAEASGIMEPLYKQEMLGHLEDYAAEIRRYQRLVFIERDIILLRYLEAWCLYESNYYLKPIGTVSFDLVWEDVLRGVFGHKELDKKIGFGAPRYYIGNNPQPYELKGDSIPDGMNFWKKDKNVRFIIIDGKYYRGHIKNNAVYGLPGYKDVAKQIDYFETLLKIYKLDAEHGRNVFIMPEWDDLFRGEFKKISDLIFVRYVGYVLKPEAKDPLKRIISSLNNLENIGADKDKEYAKVHVIQVKPDELYKAFLDGVSDTAKYADCLYEYIVENAKT